ncbi:MAG: zf-TFIIB domain-containing protein [Planctomycetota bacterium]|nr:zf-TFIIB domain-containing protein [Planctomycetota bacterium]
MVDNSHAAPMRVLAACKNCKAQYDVSGQQPNDTLRCRCGGLIVVPEVRAAETRLVRCASCGAVRGAGGLNCEFCGARFSAVDAGWGSMCPGCFCRLPSDAQFCVECGLKISPQKLDAIRSDLLCPRCGVALQGRHVDRIEVFECVSCAGLWVMVGTFEAICKDSEARGRAVALTGLADQSARRFELSAEQQVRYVPCPCCKKLMNRRNFGGSSGVIIDICRDDGVWLDNQELNRIVQFIESGGLDKARDAEAQAREHSERMRPAPVPVVLSVSAGRTEFDVLPALARAVGELARVFFSGR